MILYELIDYSVLKVIWWLLLGVLLVGFAVTDGFDLGVGTLIPFVGKNDVQRRVAINSVGATWEGNQVWFITAGGALFAAWPLLYGMSFSGFYLAMFLILAAMIIRTVGFKYRSKRPSPTWRNNWDWALCFGGFVPALCFGVAIGNVLMGVPFRLDESLRFFYDGTLIGLFRPFAILTGLLSVSMLVMHGGAWLSLKTAGPVAERGRRYGSIAAVLTIILFAIGGVVVSTGMIDSYVITSVIDPNGPANPLAKTAAIQSGAWMNNYAAHPILYIVPALGFLGALGVLIGMRTTHEGLTFISSKISVAGIISTVGVSMFPFIIPSNEMPNASLTVWDSSSSHGTLFNMLVAAVIFVPIILAYTSWVYKVLWGKIDEKTIENDNETAY